MTRTISPIVYLIVLLALVLLTCLTVGLSFVALPGPWHLVLGLGIATVKAGLVVGFFMHAILSPRVTWIVIMAGCVAVLILFGLTLCDYWTRGLLSYLPAD